MCHHRNQNDKLNNLSSVNNNSLINSIFQKDLRDLNDLDQEQKKNKKINSRENYLGKRDHKEIREKMGDQIY